MRWDRRLCDCGSERDYRATACRACFLQEPEGKWCSGCSSERPRAEFWRRSDGGLVARCKTCSGRDQKESRAVRPEYFRAKDKNSRNYKKASDRIVRRRKADPMFRLAERLRASVREALQRRGLRKDTKTVTLIGCSIDDFRAHIEELWLEGMSWANWGHTLDCWHLDHIRPVASFDLSDRAQVKACFHYSNYQPLWALDNARKGAKWSPTTSAEAAA